MNLKTEELESAHSHREEGHENKLSGDGMLGSHVPHEKLRGCAIGDFMTRPEVEKVKKRQYQDHCSSFYEKTWQGNRIKTSEDAITVEHEGQKEETKTSTNSMVGVGKIDIVKQGGLRTILGRIVNTLLKPNFVDAFTWGAAKYVLITTISPFVKHKL